MRSKLLCVSMAILMLSGCGKASTANTQADSSSSGDSSYSDESSITTTLPDSSSNEPAVTQNFEQREDYDEQAKDFLTTLKNCDTKKLKEDTCAASERVFDFLKDIKIDSFKFDCLKTEEELYTYSVKLTVSKSANEQFPVGESEWLLGIDPGAASNIDFFIRADSKINIMKRNPNSIALCVMIFLVA